MRMAPRTITLGERSWRVRPLTLAQVQAIEPLLAGSGNAGTVAAAVAILRVALARDHAEAAATLEEVEAGAPAIAGAMTAVLRLGGFLPDTVVSGDAAPGEAGAGSPPASTGAPSTPG